MRSSLFATLALTFLTAGCGLPWLHDAPGHVVTADRNGRDTASLAVVSGATTVTVRTADLHDDLFRISTPDDSGLIPSVDGTDVHLADRGGDGPKALDIVLSDEVTWDLRFSGGANSTVVDLSGGRLSAVDFAAGSSRIEAVLPPPAGSVRVRMGGGAAEFVVRAPDGVPVRVTADGGAASVDLDGDHHSGIAGGTVFAPPGWDTAHDRYDIDNEAGVSTFQLVRR